MFELIRERGSVPEEEMYEVFNMGCGFCCVVAAGDEEPALELLRRPLPGGQAIGRATEDVGGVLRRPG